MTLHGLMLFGLAFSLSAAIPGPGIAALIARVLSFGTSGIAAFIAGFVIADLTWFALAATGMAALSQKAHALFMLVKLAGAAYLFFLAYRLWSTPARPIEAVADPSERTGWRIFIGGLTVTLSNPKAMVFFMALLPSLVDLKQLTFAAFCQVAVLIGVILSSVLGLYAFVTMRARRVFESGRPALVFSRIAGTVLAVVAVVVVSR